MLFMLFMIPACDSLCVSALLRRLPLPFLLKVSVRGSRYSLLEPWDVSSLPFPFMRFMSFMVPCL
jgi:hypothetical protein